MPEYEDQGEEEHIEDKVPQKVTILDRLLNKLTGGDFKRQVTVVEIIFLISLVGLVLLVATLWVTKIEIKVSLSDSVMEIEEVEGGDRWVRFSGYLDLKHLTQFEIGQKAIVKVTPPGEKASEKLDARVDNTVTVAGEVLATVDLVLDEPLPQEFYDIPVPAEIPCKIQIILAEKTIPALLIEKGKAD